MCPYKITMYVVSTHLAGGAHDGRESLDALVVGARAETQEELADGRVPAVGGRVERRVARLERVAVGRTAAAADGRAVVAAARAATVEVHAREALGVDRHALRRVRVEEELDDVHVPLARRLHQRGRAGRRTVRGRAWFCTGVGLL